MPTTPLASFQTYYADIEDPRVERTRTLLPGSLALPSHSNPALKPA